MKLFRILIAGLTLVVSNISFGQGIVQDGGYLIVTDGAFVVIDQTNGNYKATSAAAVTLSPNAKLLVGGNWINNGTTPVFTSNDGKVEFTGGAQTIGGIRLTAFPDLNFVGNGAKKLLMNTLVGGGFNGGGKGLLRLNANVLNLNGFNLIINNKSGGAITYSGSGGILSETNSATGYSFIQWNIRDGNSGPIFTFPFVNALGQKIPAVFTSNLIGTQVKDSGFISVATYPTVNVPVPNNRPMPTGVLNLENECQGENSQRMVDRFWYISDNGYTKKPDMTLALTYADPDLTASYNTISEASVGLVNWNSGLSKWMYPVKGSVNTTTNTVTYKTGTNFSGNWVVSDTTPFPKAAFLVTGTCEHDSIVFTDKSGTVANDNVVAWQYDFGDGKTAATKNAITHYSPAGIFNTRLVIRSQSGCQDTAYKKIQIIAAPIANITVSDTCENALVKFKSQSFSGSGFITSEIWDFGMGTGTVSGNTGTYYYGSVGIPVVKLVVVNSNKCKDTATRTLFIAPKPGASMLYQNDCEGTPISFTNGSTAGGGSITGYLWDFGNKKMSSNSSANITYNAGGNYNVSLAVTNSYGCSDTAKGNITIYPRAIADFSYTPERPIMVDEIQFINKSANDSVWSWFFGDGSFDNLEFPQHAYDMYGKYTVTLVASTPHGCADTISKQIVPRSKPLYFFPNVFTPGITKGLNDDFGLVTPMALQQAITQYHLIIYNAWGEIIFKSDDPSIKWDGRYNGELVPLGVYAYRCIFRNPEDEGMEYFGYVEIIR